MRRLLTGYAVFYNRRHRRHGQLFQNRFKSILCQEDTYLDKVTLRVSTVLEMEPEQIWAPGKQLMTVKARSLLCYWAVRQLGFSATELSKRLRISQPSVSISVKRGETIAKAEHLNLVEDKNVIILWNVPYVPDASPNI